MYSLWTTEMITNGGILVILELQVYPDAITTVIGMPTLDQ
jgi:hypothetical protein